MTKVFNPEVFIDSLYNIHDTRIYSSFTSDYMQVDRVLFPNFTTGPRWTFYIGDEHIVTLCETEAVMLRLQYL